VLFLVSTVLGLVSMGSSLLLVGLVLDSPNPGSLFQKWNLPVPVRKQPLTHPDMPRLLCS
jgi:hypothetical protein